MRGCILALFLMNGVTSPTFGQMNLMPTLGHTGVVKCTAISSDGRLGVTGGMDGTVRLWDLSKGAELRVFSKLGGPVNGVALSKDGNLVSTASDDGTARVWEAATAKDLRHMPVGEGTDPIQVVSFMPGGTTILAGSPRYPGSIWNFSSKEFAGNGDLTIPDRFSPQAEISASPVYSRSGGKVFVGLSGGTVVIDDLQSNKLMSSLKVSAQPIVSMDVSRDGSRIVTADSTGKVAVWRVADGKRLLALPWTPKPMEIGRTWRPEDSPTPGVAFGKMDNTLIVTRATHIELWDLVLLRMIKESTHVSTKLTSMAISKQSDLALTGGSDGRSYLWNTASGNLVRVLGGTTGIAVSVAAPLKDQYDFLDDSGRVWVWKAANESLPHREARLSDFTTSIAMAANGQVLLAGQRDSTIDVLDTRNGSVQMLRGHTGPVTSVAISGDGKIALSGSTDGTSKLWSIGTQQVRDLDVPRPREPSPIRLVALSGDGTKALSLGEKLIYRDLSDGAHAKTIDAWAPGINALAFSDNGNYAFLGGISEVFNFRDSSSFFVPPNDPSYANKEAPLTHMDATSVDAVAFSRDARFGFRANRDNSIDMYDLFERVQLGGGGYSDPTRAHFSGHFDQVTDLAVNRGGDTLVSSSRDGTIAFWPIVRRPIVAGRPEPTASNLRLGFSVLGKWWLVSNDSRFDVSDFDGASNLYWIPSDAPFNALPLEIFMRDYYEPRLVPRLLACTRAEEQGVDASACKNAFPGIRDLSSLNRVQPEVKILGVQRGADADEAIVDVEALGKEDKTQPNDKTKTKAYDLRLFRDGQLVGQWPEPTGSTSGPQELAAWQQASMVPSPNHRFKVKVASRDLSQPVVFTAYAFNEDRVKSETVQATYAPPANMPRRPAKAYVITVGIDGYQNQSWDLGFATKDARDMSTALRQIKDYEVIPVTLVSDAPLSSASVNQATKANIHAVLELLSGRREHLNRLAGVTHVGEFIKATPDDLVILAFSGHGYTEKDGTFYLLPSDANPAGDIPRSSLRSFISSGELSEWLRDVDAGQMAMIIDACHSAASVDIPGFKPGPMGDRGLGQLAYDKGMRILAASQGDDIALEIENLHQGLLTYALIQDGLRPGSNGKLPADLAGNGQVTLEEWLKYGEQRTPRLYQDIRDNKIKAVAYETGPGNAPRSRDPKPNADFLDQAFQHAQTPSLFDFHKNTKDVVLKDEASSSKPAAASR